MHAFLEISLHDTSSNDVRYKPSGPPVGLDGMLSKSYCVLNYLLKQVKLRNVVKF